MAVHRTRLPQLSGQPFLTDGGLETDMVFNHGFELPAFAAHTLLETEKGRQALEDYFRGFLTLARDQELGFILDTVTWRAQRFFADELGVQPAALKTVNEDAVAFAAGLRREFATNRAPIVLNAAIGPRGDAYAPEDWISADAAHAYHAEQLGWLAETDIDMATALTFTNSAEAIGVTRAAADVGLPIAISFTVETDGVLPRGETLASAIQAVDDATDGGPIYYMLNCAHPSHILPALDRGSWTKRLKGLRCNASRLSHAELDACETLDAGDPDALSAEYLSLLEALPELSIFGGCCGTDLRHVTAVAERLRSGRAAA